MDKQADNNQFKETWEGIVKAKRCESADCQQGDPLFDLTFQCTSSYNWIVVNCVLQAWRHVT